MKAQRVYKPTDKTRTLTVQLEGIHRHPVHQAEVTAAGSNFNLRKRVDNFIVRSRGQILKKACILCCQALGLHNFIACLPQAQKLWNQLRRVLQIAIHGNHCIAVSVIQATGERHLMTIIAAQHISLHMLILRRQLCQNQRTAITRTIVHKNNIIVIFFLLHNSSCMLIKFMQIILFIKYRYNKGNFLHIIHHLSLMSAVDTKKAAVKAAVLQDMSTQ